MNVSIVITCYNEQEHIRGCLNSLVSQDYPKERYEIIVSDGASKDKTREIVKEFIELYPFIKLTVVHKRGTAAGRNAGVKAASFDYIAFTDADCEVPPDWLATMVRDYLKFRAQDDAIVAIGGPNIAPIETSKFVKAIGVAQDSVIGSFHSHGRQFQRPRYVPELSNLNVLYDKRRIIEVGGYDESLGSEAEDADLNFRLFSAGYKFLFITDSFVWHKMRPTPKGLFKNMFRYGKGRARLLKRYPRMWRVSFVLPLIFIACMGAALLAPVFKVLYIVMAYFPALFCFSFFHGLKKNAVGLTVHVMVAYMIMHFGYAIGELYGLVNPEVK